MSKFIFTDIEYVILAESVAKEKKYIEPPMLYKSAFEKYIISVIEDDKFKIISKDPFEASVKINKELLLNIEATDEFVFFLLIQCMAEHQLNDVYLADHIALVMTKNKFEKFNRAAFTVLFEKVSKRYLNDKNYHKRTGLIIEYLKHLSY